MLADEVLEQAITRAEGLVYFGGCSAVYTLGVTGPTSYTGATGVNLEALRASAVAQTEKKFLFLVDSVSTSLSHGGLAHDVKDLSNSYTRVLHYTGATHMNAFKWGYAGRAMSTNFDASNVASTMNTRDLKNVAVDEGLTSTLMAATALVGADTYPNIAGQPTIRSQGANEFFDDVYNLTWFLGALEVAGFNHLRMTSTKIPQTEAGMNGLKSAYRLVCNQAVNNGFLSPGEWTGNDTFGDPEDFRRSIRAVGYFIYSQPVALQSVATRLTREAPVIQIAIKYAGAIHKTSVIVNINK
jgi:hypothetical protein